MMTRSWRKWLQAICFAMVGLVAGCATPPPPASPVAKAPAAYPVDQGYPFNRDEVGLIGDSLYALVDERVAGFRRLTGRHPIAWGRYICRLSGSNLSADEFP